MHGLYHRFCISYFKDCAHRGLDHLTKSVDQIQAQVRKAAQRAQERLEGCDRRLKSLEYSLQGNEMEVGSLCPTMSRAWPSAKLYETDPMMPAMLYMPFIATSWTSKNKIFPLALYYHRYRLFGHDDISCNVGGNWKEMQSHTSKPISHIYLISKVLSRS